MKNSGVYKIIVVTAIVIFGVILIFRPTDQYTHSEQQFSIENTSHIRYIEISEKDVSSRLQNTPSGWVLLPATETRNDAIKLLLETIQRIKTIAPVPRQSEQRVYQQMQTQAKQVSIQIDNRWHTYQIYFDTTDNATYGRLQNAQTIYSLRTMGYNGKNISALFPVTPLFWKSNILINVLPHDIDSISIQYINKPGKSFSIKVKDTSLLIYNHKGRRQNNIQQALARGYLNYFTQIRYESVTEKCNTGALITGETQAFVNIYVSSNNNNNQLLLYRKPMANSSDTFDVNRLYCLNNNELSVLRYVDIDPVLQEINYFLEK